MDLEKYILTKNNTARQALQLINELAIPNVAIFIINENKQLIGSLTDGDIRRGLLNGVSIEEPVLRFMNLSPKQLVEGENNFLKVKEYKSKGLRFVPVIDRKKVIVQLLDLEKINSLIPADAVLMAGGKGERLKPLTDHVPKPMLKIGNKPVIIRNIDRLASFGLCQFHISVRHMAEQIEAGVLEEKNSSITISFVKEDKPLGTIGSLKLVKDFQNDTIILMNSDLLTNIDFQDFYQKFIDSKADMQVATIPYHVDIPYAVMNINENEEVLSFSEKPRYTYYSNAGIYIFKKELIDLIPQDVMFDATHFMEAVIASQYKLHSYPLLEYWLDIGRVEDFYKAQEDIKHLKF